MAKNNNATATPAANPAPAPATEAVQLRVKKLTGKYWPHVKVGKENGVKIAGTIRGMKTKASTLDSSKTFAEFHGDFRAMLKDAAGVPEILISGMMILPSYPEGVLENAFKAAFNVGAENVAPSITFAILLYKQDDSKNSKNARGFIWELDELRPIAPVTIQNDPLLKLLA